MLFLAFEAEDLWLTPLRMIGAVLCNFLYKVIAWIYQLFITVSRLNILSSDEIGPIYQRVTMILTIVMVFYITFEFVKYIVQPDTITDKGKGAGNLAVRLIIVIVLIAFVPRIFTLAYELQNKIIENQVLSKVILGKTNSDFDSFGSEFSANILGLFYGIDEQACAGNDCSKEQAIVNNNLVRLRTEGELDLTTGMGEYNAVTVDGEKKDVAVIKFDGIMAIVIGVFIVYILALYSIDVGTRYAQLLFLQIMSPVAIMGYISPKKDGIFQKWTKQSITTYLDLFIRLSLIYFVLLIIDVLGDSYSSGTLFAGLEGISSTIRVFSYIVLVLGLLVFANKAPKMIQDLLGNTGAAGIGFGLKGSDRVAPMAARAIGAGAGGLSAMARRGIDRTTGELNRRRRVKDKLLEESKPTDRASMRNALREDRKNARDARKHYRWAKDTLSNERDKVVEAEKNLRNAKNRGASEQEIKNLETKLQAAKDNFELKKRGGDALVSKNTRDNLRNVESKIEAAKRDGSYDKMSDIDKAKLDAELRNARAQYNREAEGYDQKKLQYQQALDREAASKNSSYGTPIGLQVAGAAVQGLFTGVTTGSQATKAGDISKKVTEAAKKATDSEKARFEWLESGGGATLDASISKKITEIQQRLGIKTEAERIKLDIKELETDVKKIDAQIAMENGVKKGQDGAEDRTTGKIKKHEQKIQIKPTDKNSLNISVNGTKEAIDAYVMDDQGNIISGKTTSQIYMEYEQRANTAKAQAEAANAELIRAQMEGRTPEEISRIETLAKAKASEAELSKYRQEQVLKKLKEYTITKALSATTPEEISEIGDAVLLNNIEAMRQAIENARNNQTTVQYLNMLVAEGKLSESTFNAFINNDIKTFDDYDAIQGFLTGHTGKLSSQKNKVNEAIRAIKESAATDAANANAANSGGKK